jgi:hypothetical protein
MSTQRIDPETVETLEDVRKKFYKFPNSKDAIVFTDQLSETGRALQKRELVYKPYTYLYIQAKVVEGGYRIRTVSASAPRKPSWDKW